MMTSPNPATEKLMCTRGATLLSEHTPKAYAIAVTDLLTQVCEQNSILPEAIVGVWFTVTADLTCDNPARIARTHLPGWDLVPMLCATEPDIEGYPGQCVRVMVQWVGQAGHTPKFVYLNGCQQLRR